MLKTNDVSARDLNPAQGQISYTRMRAEVSEFAATIKDEKLRKMFSDCFYSSLESATETLSDGSVFMLTGDIPAMWLRDSSVQVTAYLPYARTDRDVKNLVKGLLKRQFFYIALDPYANAFNRDPNNHGHKDDVTDFDSPWVWERKFEIDSLCYPLWLADKYAETTDDYSVFDGDFKDAFVKILDTFETEQFHGERSKYIHSRPKYPEFPTLSNGGKGEPAGYTGLIWNGYRPSDDVCTYGYLIPSNQFALTVLKRFIDNAEKTGLTDNLKRMQTIAQRLEEGLKKFAVVRDPDFGEIYAYETDGLGHYNLMDDANVPSLLSLPYLGFCKADDPIYVNTRKFVLSRKNPYYYEGRAAKGVGSPHTPERYIWHIGIAMQLLTSTDRDERRECLKLLTETDAGTGVMHEGFDCDNPEKFTRPWFCWANTLFALCVVDMKERGEIE